jgi:hypothetical protein
MISLLNSSPLLFLQSMEKFPVRSASKLKMPVLTAKRPVKSVTTVDLANAVSSLDSPILASIPFERKERRVSSADLIREGKRENKVLLRVQW